MVATLHRVGRRVNYEGLGARGLGAGALGVGARQSGADFPVERLGDHAKEAQTLMGQATFGGHGRNSTWGGGACQLRGAGGWGAGGWGAESRSNDVAVFGS